jgi:pimeloyl-ACP methyl ester carboxylesterase
VVLSNERSPVSTERKQPGQPPLILLPGLGGDFRMFGPQRSAFPELIVPPWIEPERNEPLAVYAARFAKVIDPGQVCFVGGASFGGVVALEVASHLKAGECYLFGSIRDPRELPRRLRFFRSISDLVIVPKRFSPMVLSCGGRWINPITRGVLHQVHEADERFLRWAAEAILKWTPSAGVERVRVIQIHGDRDWVFPVGRTSADKVIAGAGHLISITHADEVNRFVRARMLLLAEIATSSPEFSLATRPASESVAW